MSSISQDDSDYETTRFPKDLVKKVEELYERFGLDVDDMTEEELGRIYKHYMKNPDQIDQDLANLVSSKYSNNKSITKTGRRNVKQEKDS